MCPIDWQYHAKMFSRSPLAAALGSLTGYERQRAGKPAGMRTHRMVALGAALFTVISTNGFGGADPARVAAQFVNGIGFLGASAILHMRGSVHGLTTAAKPLGDSGYRRQRECRDAVDVSRNRRTRISPPALRAEAETIRSPTSNDRRDGST